MERHGAVKETDGTGSSSNDKGAVSHALGPAPDCLDNVGGAWTAVHIAKPSYAGKYIRPN